jgi:aspartyl-tRNA(Asn)/glutamyl-tRNA(Gln) amidotransferase subunit A
MSSLTDDIAGAARRAGWALAGGRAEQIAQAVAPRLAAFAKVRAQLRFDDAPDFEAVLQQTRYRPEASRDDTRGSRNSTRASPDATRLHDLTLAEAAHAVTSGVVSSAELTQHMLSRAQRHQYAFNAFIHLDADEALRAAREADDALAQFARSSSSRPAPGPLHGVPIAYKDMFYRDGVLATCGSRHRRDWIAPVTAEVVARLQHAGAVAMGGLNMTEFAYGPTGQNEFYGDVRNPWDTSCISGGSSSGSAVAVAARLAFATLGSDTAGSVRMPATLCGITGMKTTHGAVSRYGCMPLSSSLDTVGPLTRDVRDNALMLSLLAGHDERDAASRKQGDLSGELAALCAEWALDEIDACSAPLRGLRIGRPQGYFDQGLDPLVAATLDAAAHAFEALGATLVPVTMPDLDAVNAAGVLMTWGDVLTLHGSMMRDAPQHYSAQTRGRIEVALGASAQDVMDAHRYRGIALREFAASVFGACDVLLAPNLALPTPRLAQVDVRGGVDMMRILDEITRLTRPANVLGLPALALPCGASADGLPIGMQLLGRPFSEAQLYRVGQAYQRVTQWHLRVPPLAAT